ncbi:unnamed protein product [Candidula unifasciata]|uniref:Uncharacterized protein n=1 Tax=Candidula unifasciata TaxID=100452 RepID=A0A8S3YX57_9EUPU|nr:unnamed protein product [Candidula unifasciata]
MSGQQLWSSENQYQTVMEVRVRSNTKSTTVPGHGGPCPSSGHRQCKDGSCIAKVDLCAEEQTMNQNTIFIMIVVGMVVVIVLIILYCFQQRSQRRALRRHAIQGNLDSVVGDGDNTSLNMPPPSYEEVVNTNLYPATPVLQRGMSAVDEPRTPPPNYDTALDILASSHDSILPLKQASKSLVVRRSVSTEFGLNGSNRVSGSEFRRFFSNQEQR